MSHEVIGDQRFEIYKAVDGFHVFDRRNAEPTTAAISSWDKAIRVAHAWNGWALAAGLLQGQWGPYIEGLRRRAREITDSAIRD